MSISLMVSFWASRHFHLLLCNCLVLSLFIFCGKSNKVSKHSRYWSVSLIHENKIISFYYSVMKQFVSGQFAQYRPV